MSSTYWDMIHRARIGRRALLRGASGLAAGAAATDMIGCSSNNSKKAATQAATQAAGQPATRAVGTAAPSGTQTASSSPAAQAATAAGAAGGDFLSRLPLNPPDNFTDKDIQTGGTLTKLWARQITFDFMATASTGTVAEATTAVYSKLVRLAAHANMKSVLQPEIEGDLATKWEQPDSSTLIFTLAPNIKWHNIKPVNGRDFKVDDIKYSFNRGKTFDKSQYKSYYQNIGSVEDTGGGTVKVNMANPFPAGLLMVTSFFAGIMPPELGDQPDLAATQMIGTAGFMQTKNTPNVEIVYQKHPDFFKTDASGRKRPYIDGYTLSNVTDPATQLQQLVTGKAQLTYTSTNPVTLDNVEDFAKQAPKFAIQKCLAAFPGFALQGHFDRAPWNDARVRQAVSLLMDRDTIVKTLFHGQGGYGPYYPWFYLYDGRVPASDLGKWSKYDPQQAKQLLSAAGFPNGLDLDVSWYDILQVEAILTLFKQSAAQAGLRINLIKDPDNPSHYAKQSSRAWNGLIMTGRGVNFTDPSDVMTQFIPGPLNFPDLNDPKLIDINNRLNTTAGDARKAVGKELFDYLNDQAFETTLPSGDTLAVWAPTVHNFVTTSWVAQGGFGNGCMDALWLSKS